MRFAGIAVIGSSLVYGCGVATTSERSRRVQPQSLQAVAARDVTARHDTKEGFAWIILSVTMVSSCLLQVGSRKRVTADRAFEGELDAGPHSILGTDWLNEDAQNLFHSEMA